MESSCDETSIAVLKNESEILSNVIASQIESHKRFGGVVPEVASRHHVEVITTCFKDALETAGIEVSDLDAVPRSHTDLVWLVRFWLEWRLLKLLLGLTICH